MKRLLGVVIAAGLAWSAPDPYRIVPGQGFGSFGRHLNRAQLEKQLPPGQLMEGESNGKPSLSLYAMDPAKRVTVMLDGKGRVLSMSIHGYEGVWHTREGIGLGSSLQDLEKANGGPFQFRSLGSTEDAGRVLNWRGGRLSKPYARLTLTFAGAMHSRGYSSLNEAEHERAEADGLIMSSADPLARKLNPIVETIRLDF